MNVLVEAMRQVSIDTATPLLALNDYADYLGKCLVFPENGIDGYEIIKDEGDEMV